MSKFPPPFKGVSGNSRCPAAIHLHAQNLISSYTKLSLKFHAFPRKSKIWIYFVILRFWTTSRRCRHIFPATYRSNYLYNFASYGQGGTYLFSGAYIRDTRISRPEGGYARIIIIVPGVYTCRVVSGADQTSLPNETPRVANGGDEKGAQRRTATRGNTCRDRTL